MIICLGFVWTLLLGMNKCYDTQSMSDKYGMDMLNNDNVNRDIILEMNNNRNDYESLVNDVVLEEINEDVINRNVYLSKMNKLTEESNIISYDNYTLNITCTSSDLLDSDDTESKPNCLIKKLHNVLTRKVRNLTNLTAVFTNDSHFIYIHENHTKILENYVNKNDSCKWIMQNQLPKSHNLYNNNNNRKIYSCNGKISLPKPLIIEFSPYIKIPLYQEDLITKTQNSTDFNIIVDLGISSNIWNIGNLFTNKYNITTTKDKVYFSITTEFSYSTINIFLSVFVIITSIILFASSNCCYKKKFK